MAVEQIFRRSREAARRRRRRRTPPNRALLLLSSYAYANVSAHKRVAFNRLRVGNTCALRRHGRTYRRGRFVYVVNTAYTTIVPSYTGSGGSRTISRNYPFGKSIVAVLRRFSPSSPRSRATDQRTRDSALKTKNRNRTYVPDGSTKPIRLISRSARRGNSGDIGSS